MRTSLGSSSSCGLRGEAVGCDVATDAGSTFVALADGDVGIGGVDGERDRFRAIRGGVVARLLGEGGDVGLIDE